ncbi:H-NS histone family protein [Pontibaca methylaminivorans]|uniref:DNA-binding protein H-NS n=1 Tax=Pontibaca methylaminivorans TaxID=515897 RepID=A0A1R3X712_9RHOB|nr:H-NS histone family protein [Pontibaca methylaminivorans]SIT86521.1 DNA-binding protein H-NS [Pontibaca methylaminivorans]
MDRLGEMSREELLQLQSKVKRALKEADKRDRQEAKIAAQQAVAKYGYQLEDLVNFSGKGGASPKYRNPENPTQTWSGRGRRPRWVHDAIANGRDISELEL